MTTMTARDAAQAACITYRQLDYWDRTGLITPIVPSTGHGSRREYDELDVMRLKLVSRMLGHGFTLERVRHVLNFSREILSMVDPFDAFLIITDEEVRIGGCDVVAKQECNSVCTIINVSDTRVPV